MNLKNIIRALFRNKIKRLTSETLTRKKIEDDSFADINFLVKSHSTCNNSISHERHINFQHSIVQRAQRSRYHYDFNASR
jgi:hypothetical protein